jgi:hypothetical protein
VQRKFMARSKPQKENKATSELRDDAKIDGKLPGSNISEKFDIEQARIENRREADLEDKTPAGDAGVEDNKDERQEDDPIGESNY